MSNNQTGLISTQHSTHTSGLKFLNGFSTWIYLDDDYRIHAILSRKVPPGSVFQGLGSNFHYILDATKRTVISLLQQMGNRLPREAWWAGSVASRSSTATNVVRNSVYAVFARQFLTQNPNKTIAFICGEPGLAQCIAKISILQGRPVRLHHSARFRSARLGILLRPVFRSPAFVLYFIWKRLLACLCLLGLKHTPGTKCVLLRSWVTHGTISQTGEFQDRNFGELPAFLNNSGFDAAFTPTVFGLRHSLWKHYRSLAKAKERFFLPEIHCGPWAWIGILLHEFRRYFMPIDPAKINGADVGGILRYAIKCDCFRMDLMNMNLAGPMLKKLAKRNMKIEKIIYAFENLTVEKPFLLAAKRHFPNAQTIGYQHTIAVSEQLATEIIPDELSAHPFPDRIVCSGEKYVEILTKLGFPPDKLILGPNLRFSTARNYRPIPRQANPAGRIRIYLPLPFCPNRSYQLIDKMARALREMAHPEVLIKPHPLLSRKDLEEMIRQSELPNWRFDEKPCLEALKETDMAAFCGASIVQLEAVLCGVPILRLIPENTFTMDPMFRESYPIPPASTPEELLTGIQKAVTMDRESLYQLASVVKESYFSPSTPQLMQAFN